MEQNNSGAQKEMPRYKSHKKIWALKIKSIDGNRITPEETGQGIISVTDEYLAKHQPQVGGYYVMYEDGYKSFSPADAFEKGNTLIGTSGLSFGEAKQALDEGKMVFRTGWNGKGMFVFKQVPAEIGMDIVPKMQSLPQAVKDEFVRRQQGSSGNEYFNAIRYSNQLALVSTSNMITGWAPSTSDALADDWEIYS